MYPTSDVFKRRIRQSGLRKTVVDIYYNGMTIAENVPVSDGSINVDQDSEIRRSGSITIPDRRLVPGLSSVLSPYGTEIVVRQGIVYPNGDEELVPLGTFILDTTSWDEEEGPIPKIEFYDRAMVMRRAEIGPTFDASGRNAQEIITGLFAYFWPDLTVTFGPGLTDPINPGGTAYDDGNHWDIVEAQAAMCGAEVYFNADGNPMVTALPVFDSTIDSSDSVWDVNTGDTGILQSASRSVTRDGTYNSVYVIGTAPEGGNIPTGHALNNDPTSPTYREGPFRKMGKRYSVDTLKTDAECLAYAERELDILKRFSQILDFTAVPNPALDVGDVVLMSYLSGETQVAMIQTLSIPLGSGSFTGKCTVARV